MRQEFQYTTYIRSSREKVFAALTSAEFTKQYWGWELKSDWNKGSIWQMASPRDGTRAVHGEVLEIAPPSRLAYSWHSPEDAGVAPQSRVVFELEQIGDMVCLTVAHTGLTDTAAAGVSKGWPRVMASLKSFIETGKGLDIASLKCTPASAARGAA